MPKRAQKVVTGTSVAYGYSAFVTLWPQLAARWGLPMQLYYETAVVIVALVLSGRWLEARARRRATAAIRAMAELQPRTARVVRAGIDEIAVVTQIPRQHRQYVVCVWKSSLCSCKN